MDGNFFLIKIFTYVEKEIQNKIFYIVERYRLKPADRSFSLMNGFGIFSQASSSPNQAMNFCQEYVRLRAETFMCHAQLLHACLSLRTAPPPAIAASLATSTRDDLLRCGRVSQQLTKSARDFNTLASQYGTLYQVRTCLEVLVNS